MSYRVVIQVVEVNRRAPSRTYSARWARVVKIEHTLPGVFKTEEDAEEVASELQAYADENRRTA